MLMKSALRTYLSENVQINQHEMHCKLKWQYTCILPVLVHFILISMFSLKWFISYENRVFYKQTISLGIFIILVK